MKPILFPSTETTFTTKGLGTLSDAISCKVAEERNGIFELEMSYPMTGNRFSEIKNRCIILAKPNNTDDPQAFRIYRITKPINGKVSIYAEHISYDLSGIPDLPFTAGTAAAAHSNLKSKAAVACPFTFSTDLTTSATMTLSAPASVKSILVGKEGSVVDVYGGEWKYNNFSASLLKNRGSDNGVSIRYGKNLVTLEQEENISSVYTGVLPFYYSESDGEVHGNIQSVLGTFDFTKIMPLDLTDKFEEVPTAAQLEAEAILYIQRNDIGTPAVSLKVSFVELSKASGYEQIAPLETVNLCDTVTVVFEKLGIETKAKIVKTVYDVLKERYESVEIGTVKKTVADTIAEQSAKLTAAPTKDFMQKAIAYATELITGNRGGFVILHDSDGSGSPDEILIMDTADINTAVQVWRWNKDGLGYSSTGYEGPYGTAITIDGTIIGNYLKVNTVEADKIVDHSLDDTQMKTGGISVGGSSGGGTESGVLADYTIGNLNMAPKSIAYGNTQFTGTLDQVGINAANINALSAYFSGALIGKLYVNDLTVNTFKTRGLRGEWKMYSGGGFYLAGV